MHSVIGFWTVLDKKKKEKRKSILKAKQLFNYENNLKIIW